MLGKVMKYEFKACARWLVPLYALGLGLSVLLRLLALLVTAIWAPPLEVIGGIVSGFASLLMVAVMLLTLAAVVVRFYQSLVAHEAYLNFTLPVKAGTHLLARMFNGALWLALGWLVVRLGNWAAMLGLPSVEATLVSTSSASISASSMGPLFHVFVYLLPVAAFIASMMQIYAAVSIAASAGRAKVPLSIGAYFALNAVEGLTELLLAGSVLGLYISGKGGWVPFLNSIITQADAGVWGPLFHFIAVVGGTAAAIALVFMALNYLIARYCFTRRLNLE